MVKMKMSTASDMCTLFCALIVCTLVSTARTASTNNITNSVEFHSEDCSNCRCNKDQFFMWVGFEGRTHPLNKTLIANGKYGLKITPDTPSGTDLNDLMIGDEANISLMGNVIGKSEKPEKKSYSSIEPISTNDHTYTILKEPTTRTGSTARTTNTTPDGRNVSEFDSTEDEIFEDWLSTTPGTPSGTDLNVKPPKDVIENSTSQPNPKNGYNLSNKRYSSTQLIPANDYTRSKHVTMKNKAMWSTSHKPFYWLNRRYNRPTEWIKPTIKNCKCVFTKFLKCCKNNEEETPTTKIWNQPTEYKKWDQQRHMRETTTINVEERQKILEMESYRFNSILDVFNSLK